ncbi:hypothetical protein TNCV_2867261 [Trichonephila clavipes]|nr:hypothetical protein TNCV_2867261 [Trichonephila clavipes]
MNRLLCEGYKPLIQATSAILNFCADLSWTTPETFDTTRTLSLISPSSRMQSEDKGDRLVGIPVILARAERERMMV